jgi:hypothetical protein
MIRVINIDAALPEDRRSTRIRSSREVTGIRETEPTRESVDREKKEYKEKGNVIWRNRWKIAAAAIGAYTLYHFRYWMREKLHLAFSKVPQNEIEGNMGTTAVLGDRNRPLPGNAEGGGTTTGPFGF